jgi:hypothetical protein
VTADRSTRGLLDEIDRLREENRRLRDAALTEPLTIEQVTAALHEGHAQRRVAEHDNAWTSLVRQRDRFRAALAEALDLFDATWCPEHGHQPRPEQLARAAELRKLVKP